LSNEKSKAGLTKATAQGGSRRRGATGALKAQSGSGWSPKKQSVGGPIRSGHLLFLSGIGGWYPERRPKPGDVREQTADALTIMKESLQKAGP